MGPNIFDVVDFKLHIWWHADFNVSIYTVEKKLIAYSIGCMGLRSLPRTYNKEWILAGAC
jgi:hypothetical protein